MSETTTTPVSQWKSPRLQGQLFKLPSGNVARLKRTLSMMTLIEDGKLPNPLMGHVARALGMDKDVSPEAMAEKVKSGEANVEDVEFADTDEDALNEMLSLISAECSDIFVEPRVMQVPPGEDPNTWSPEEDGAVSIMDIDWKDRIAAYNFAQGAPADMVRFLDESQDVQPRSDVDEVPLPTE